MSLNRNYDAYQSVPHDKLRLTLGQIHKSSQEDIQDLNIITLAIYGPESSTEIEKQIFFHPKFPINLLPLYISPVEIFNKVVGGLGAPCCPMTIGCKISCLRYQV